MTFLLSMHFVVILHSVMLKSQVRQINMYKEGDVTPYGQILEDCTVRQCWDECIASSQYEERKSEAELYNRLGLPSKRDPTLNINYFRSCLTQK
jgi:xanthine dehydrogenase molybdopterin-binding subunit B